MLRERDLMFTQEDICGAAHVNLVSLIMTATQFAVAQGIDVDTFWHFIGEKFATRWHNMPPGNVEQVAQRIAHNLASCGAEVESFTGSAHEATLVMSGYPPAWALESYDGSPAEAARMLEVFVPIVRALELDYRWSFAGGEITIVVKR